MAEHLVTLPPDTDQLDRRVRLEAVSDRARGLNQPPASDLVGSLNLPFCTCSLILFLFLFKIGGGGG